MNNIAKDKIKQFVGMVGGFLGALCLALKSVGIEFEWFNEENINVWLDVLYTGIPLLFVLYGVWKNTYIVTKRAREEEEWLNKFKRNRKDNE